MTRRARLSCCLPMLLLATQACVKGEIANGGTADAAPEPGSAGSIAFVPSFDELPAAGNPDGHCPIPADAQPEDSSTPDHVIGTGTRASCESAGDAFVDAVAQGGVITFDCGPDPVTITLTRTAKVFNDKAPKIVIDGGGKVALSGGGQRRILYMNTCDQKQTWTTPHCDNQDHPQLTVQNLTFVNGNSKGEVDTNGSPQGGGAIYASGGRLKVINSRFFNNVCDDVGPDVGGAAVRAFQQFEGKPLYVVNSTFGGKVELANVCSNGGGLSAIGVSYTVINSLFSHNAAIGHGANPAQPGTPGGGSGGAIYNDGGNFTLNVCGTLIEHNSAKAGGGAIFYVSNSGDGTFIVKDSVMHDNPNEVFDSPEVPGSFVKTNQPLQISGSMIAK